MSDPNLIGDIIDSKPGAAVAASGATLGFAGLLLRVLLGKREKEEAAMATQLAKLADAVGAMAKEMAELRGRVELEARLQAERAGANTNELRGMRKALSNHSRRLEKHGDRLTRIETRMGIAPPVSSPSGFHTEGDNE